MEMVSIFPPCVDVWIGMKVDDDTGKGGVAEVFPRRDYCIGYSVWWFERDDGVRSDREFQFFVVGSLVTGWYLCRPVVVSRA